MLWLECDISPKGYYVNNTWSLAGGKELRGEALLKEEGY